MVSASTHQLSASQNQTIPPKRQIVIIDPHIDDYQILAAAVLPGVELLILKPDRDGIEQITKYLQTAPLPPCPPTLHLISHGSPGRIHLGNSTLELNNIEQYRPQLEKWGIAHLYIYGCKVAAGDAGAEFLQKLHQITQAQIHANPKPTGNAAKGGTWELQPIQSCPPAPLPPCPPAPLLLNPHTLATYPGILLEPEYAWAKNMGGSSGDGGNSITIDSSGNIYTIGGFSGTADFDPGTGTSYLTAAGNQDIFISKLNPDGSFAWAKQLGGSAMDFGWSIAIDSSGNVYTTGSFQGTADFDPGPGTFNLTSGGSDDIFISKLNPDGTFAWAKSMGAGGSDRGSSITVDNSGNIYTTGYFRDTVDFDPGSGTANLTSAGSEDIFISKLNPDGSFAWAKSMGGSSGDYGNSITIDSSGKIYTTGYFQGSADFDPGTGTINLTSAGSYDIFISKLNSDGTFVWAKQMGGSSGDIGNSITLDSSGNIYTTGYFTGTADFNPGTGTHNLTSAGRATFISRLNSNGSFAWAKQLGGIYGNSIAIDSNGNIYTMGNFQGTADFDPGPGTYNLTSTAGYEDIFISKLNPDATFASAGQLGGSAYDYGSNIAIDSSDNIYTTGYFTGTADFDPGPGTANLTSAGSQDIFISKLTPGVAPTVTSITSAAGDDSYRLGSLIPITVTFSEPVTVTGTPTLTLNTGATAAYGSGSGTNTLTFNYTVGTSENSPDLDYISTTALNLNGGTIQDGATNDADLTLPSPGTANSLGANKDIIIDTTPPTVTVEQAAAQTDPATASPINFTVTFSEPVTSFDPTDISFTGTTTTGTLTPTITGGGNTYNVAVSGMTSSGNVIVSINANAATDTAGNNNTASSSTDNTVTYNTIPTVNNISKTGDEDSNITFTDTDFTAAFTDADNDSLNKIQITSLPTNGTLKLGGVDVSVSDEIPVTNISNLTFTPTADYNGNSSFTWNGSDGSNYATNATVNLTINPVNDDPSFTATNPIPVNEDSGAITIPNWATFNPGPADEATQTATYTVSNITNPGLFAAIPTVDSSGTLSYTPTADANGISTFDVVVQDNSGGNNVFPAQTFSITVNPVNDAPSFNNAGNQTLSTWTNSLQTVNNWANTFVFGPTNENRQTVADFLVNVTTGSDLFSTPPDIANNGTLTYTPSGKPGTATISVQLQDDGSVANGGIDTSALSTFDITIPPPTVNLGVIPNSGSEAETSTITITATAAGPVFGNQTLNLALSGTADNSDFSTPIPNQITIPDGATTGSVTLTIAQDSIAEGDETATLTISNPTSGIQLGNTTNTSFTITEDDTAGITVTPISLTTTETGDNANFTVVLNSQPTADVTIPLNSDNTAEGTVIPSLTFTPANWNQPQTVTVTGLDDNVDDGDINYNIITTPATSTDPNYSGFDAPDVAVTNTDNDTAGITVTPISITTTEAGGTANFTVVFNSQPTADVTIPLNSDNTAEGTVIPSLTFTPANWNQPQTVTVTGLDDNVDDGDINYNIITAPVTSTDPNYSGFDAPDVAVTNTDNDTAGITVTPISITTTEAGGTANFTVVFNSQPTADVTINLTSDNTAEGTVIPSLTFTPANWNQPQTVTVTGVDDNLDDGDINYNIITAPVTSTDPNYSGFDAPDVAVTNTDNDTAGITVSASTINITEGGANGTYDLVLTSAPTAPVTINFTTDSEINPIAPIIFDSTNWNQPQIVTVTAVDDSNIDRFHLGNITHSAGSNDPKYNGMTISPVVANIADNDSGGVSIMQQLGSNDVLEGFGTDVYKLVLTLPPVADVTIALNTDDQITTHVPTVTFTPSNWNLPQTVTVTAVDDREPEGTHQGNITHTATSAEPAYNNLNIGGIIANISDNDNRGEIFQLSPPGIIGLTSQDDIVTGSTADDMVYDAAGNDVIDGGEGHDNLYAQAGDDGINGGSGNDVIWAGLGNDHTTGLGGNDILYGGEGNDRLYGDDGDDFLLGNSGNDFLFAGTGIDNLAGGTGRDAFVLSNGSGGMTVAEADIITDFVKGEDIFYLSGNLNFPQLVISQGMGNLANDGIIQNAVSGEFLAVVKGVAAADIVAIDFV